MAEYQERAIKTVPLWCRPSDEAIDDADRMLATLNVYEQTVTRAILRAGTVMSQTKDGLVPYNPADPSQTPTGIRGGPAIDWSKLRADALAQSLFPQMPFLSSDVRPARVDGAIDLLNTPGRKLRFITHAHNRQAPSETYPKNFPEELQIACETHYVPAVDCELIGRWSKRVQPSDECPQTADEILEALNRESEDDDFPF